MDGWIIGVLVLLGTLSVEYIIIRNFRSSLTHVVQFVMTLAFLGGLCVSANYLFGEAISLQLLNGLAIGFGIALQPLFKNIVDGIVFDSTKIQGLISGPGFKGTIHDIGMFHTWLLTEDGKLIMINNNILANNPLTLHSYDTSPYINKQTQRPTRTTSLKPNSYTF